MWRMSWVVMVLAIAASVHAAEVASVELVVAMDRGLPIDAQQRWYRLLTKAGIERLRIRQARPGEEPQIDDVGTDRRTSYRVTAILVAGERLQVPQANFTGRDLSRLQEYLKRLRDEGVEGITASRGAFGLNQRQLTALQEAMNRVVSLEVRDRPLETVLAEARQLLALPVEFEPAAKARLAQAAPPAVELKQLALGTTLAVLLRNEGLAIVPFQERGNVQLAIRVLDSRDDEQNLDAWPIGWELEEPPKKVVPILFQNLNIEIEGYSLQESLAAIQPRVQIPFLIDTRRLAAAGIDPAEVNVRFPASKTSYQRVLRHLLFQARLKGELRIDDAGNPFYWITTRGGGR